MNIIHCLAWYYPHSTGGTESYVASLARQQVANGHEVSILVPRANQSILYPYRYEGIIVSAYDPWSNVNPCKTDSEPYDSFCKHIEGAHIYHQHSITSSCSVIQLEAAKSSGLKTILTAHVPSIICIRGTMLLHGKSQCDGVLDKYRCASCWLQSKGVPATLASLLPRLSSLPAQVQFDHNTLLRKATTMLQSTLHVNAKSAELQRIFSASDAVIAVCEWLFLALKANGIDPNKLRLVRQGLETSHFKSLQAGFNKRKAATNSHKFVFGMIGRWDPVKGFHHAIQAFKMLHTNINVELIIAAPSDPSSASYRDYIYRLISSDSRISITEDVELSTLPSFLHELDALLVPSQCLETGPLVIYEAQAACLPIIGSDIGGIKELAAIYPDIHLAEPFALDSWVSSMSNLLSRTQEAPATFQPEIRSSKDVFKDIQDIYHSISLCK